MTVSGMRVLGGPAIAGLHLRKTVRAAGYDYVAGRQPVFYFDNLVVLLAGSDVPTFKDRLVRSNLLEYVVCRALPEHG